ncbi:Na/Pi symporter [Pseudomonas sp. sp1636]|uniref:Na/Pi cotransporter family protein n=1 Tax=Pseudomonas sp. sp1636 TaxID=3036707 RepID=UPI0025A58D2F|nr:Na/Pi symporter [Pseudomonas sp. sp1636]MDM8349020.1 Na/Pi symporter [Pseudomonas sp. sp1636]
MPDPGRNLRHRLRSLSWILLFALLALSFWFSAGWLALCGGLALFLFGMQCLEEGLRQLAGGKLERLLALSTATPFKSLMFGVSATLLVQSSSLVSLLTIAFLSTGLIQLAAGIAILFGANLGTTSGIWLLALAGQNVSLGPLALPLLVFGVLGSFTGSRGSAVGRVVLGVAFLFLGIDQMKAGFSSVAGDFDPLHYQLPGIAGHLLFTGAGLLITVLLQSSHATLMLTLTALAGGQLALEQGLAIAIGSNLGSTVTAVIGALGGSRVGQRLALAHVLFNLASGALALVLLVPLATLVRWLTAPMGLGGNLPIQLALFHTLFNAMGVSLFWPWQGALVDLLERWLPDREEPRVLITEVAPSATGPTRARYLDESALASADSAAQAVVLELQHLARLSLEVICHALYVPVDRLERSRQDERLLSARPDSRALDAEQLYQRHIKGVYSDLLSFMSRLEVSLDQAHQHFWVSCQLAALQLVDAVKDAKHLQKNLGRYLRQDDSVTRQSYVELRRHLLGALHEARELGRLELPDTLWDERLRQFDEGAAGFDSAFRQRLFAAVRERRLDGQQASSLMNDLGYVSRITQSLRNVLLLGQGEGNELFRPLRQLVAEDGPLIQLD